MTTAQLRQEILAEFNQVLKLAPADYTENCTNLVMAMIADYISQLELPKLTELQTNGFRAGYQRSTSDTASTLQKAVEQLRSTK